MLKNDEKYIAALRNVLKKADYAFFLKQLNGLSDFHDVWHDFDIAKKGIEKTGGRYSELIELLYLGIPQVEADIIREAGAENLNLLIEAGLWLRDGENIITDNYVIVVYQQLYIVVDIAPFMPTCTRVMTDVYIGSDSLRLAENVAFAKGASVLDLCSGSGIQGLLAAKSASKVVCAEINEKAIPVICFNAALNGFSDIIDVRCGDLYDVLDDGERFDFIYVNPPFLAIPDGTSYPICGAIGDDGMKILGRIADGLFERLNDRGEAIIYCEAFGDEKSVFFDEYLMEACRKICPKVRRNTSQKACRNTSQKACRKISQKTSQKACQKVRRKTSQKACQKARSEDAVKANAFHVTECRYNRIETALQTESMLHMARQFDSELDEAGFISGMNRIYEKTGASHLYSLLYHIRFERSVCESGYEECALAKACEPSIFIIDHCAVDDAGVREKSSIEGSAAEHTSYDDEIMMIENEIKVLEGILRKMKDA